VHQPWNYPEPKMERAVIFELFYGILYGSVQTNGSAYVNGRG
jgi:hypothetical protein